MKTKSVYICQSCGNTAPKWLGKCPNCGGWNTYVEELVSSSPSKTKVAKGGKEIFFPLSGIENPENFRIVTADAEFNRVLGGGIVPGSLVLIAGEPGIGKSTLMLQIALSFPSSHILYISGEESLQQVSMRAKRIKGGNPDGLVSAETDVLQLIAQCRQEMPALVVVDSIQTMQLTSLESAPGTVSQIRESTAEWQRFAKETNVPVFLIGHITKDGTIAGPKILEHMVDTVLQFEGERHGNYRLLRTTKNRFGSTAELGIYEMQQQGLRQVSNPSELLLSDHAEFLSGIARSAMVEGTRPLMIEVQALVSPAVYGTPQRSATGFDTRRLNMLLAVLEKRTGLRFGDRDVFLNIAGGISVQDPGIDLAVVAALVSSLTDIAIPKGMCFAGEVGLSGEVRMVQRLEARISEADKLGFDEMVIPSGGKNIQPKEKLILTQLSKVLEMRDRLFG